MKSLFGNKIPEENLFVVKPTFIGEITHGYSSLTESSSRLSAGKRKLLRAGIIIGLIAGGWFAVAYLNMDLGTKIIIALVCGLIGFLFSFALVPSVFFNAFVGTEGMAEYKIEPETREAKDSVNVKFKEAWFLFTEITDKYEHGIYKITDYNFRWFTEKAELLCEAKSRYRKGESPKQIEANINYAAARFTLLTLAEKSWTEYLKKNNSKTANGKDNNEYRFLLIDHKGSRNGFIYIRPGEFSVETKKQNIVFRKGELKDILLENGLFTFVPSVDLAKQGVDDCKVYLSNIGNSQLFIEMAYLWFDVNS